MIDAGTPHESPRPTVPAGTVRQMRLQGSGNLGVSRLAGSLPEPVPTSSLAEHQGRSQMPRAYHNPHRLQQTAWGRGQDDVNAPLGYTTIIPLISVFRLHVRIRSRHYRRGSRTIGALHICTRTRRKPYTVVLFRLCIFLGQGHGTGSIDAPRARQYSAPRVKAGG